MIDIQESIPKKKEKKSTKSRLTGIIVCVICVYLIIGVFLMVVLSGDPPKGEKELNYHFSFGTREPVLIPGSEILIPAVVDETNKPVFSESELESLRVYWRYGLPDEYAYPCDIHYATTKDGPMISLKPLNITDQRYFSVDFIKKDYEGDKFLLSPVTKYNPQFLLNLYTFPVYIRNSTFPSMDPVPIDSMTLGLSVCGYNPQDPYVCKGFASRPDQRYKITQDLIPVTTNEFGEYNQYRYCFNPLIWPEIFLNPEKCK